MKKKIFLTVFCVSILILIISFIVSSCILYDYFTSIQKDKLKSELSLIENAANIDGIDFLSDIKKTDIRITLISSDGTVLFDNKEAAENMENHSQREEFISAMENGSGESSRYSDTLTEETIYYAKKLENGNVLRVSINHKSIFYLTLGMIRPFIIIVLAALLLSYILANRLSEKIIKPINNIDLEHPLECKSYDEFSPLLTHIAHLYTQIDNQRNELINKKNEFSAIIENMNEGLIVLNNDELVLSINPSACKFLVDDNCIGKNFWQIERNTIFETNLNRSINEGNSKFSINRNGREYQLNISRIDADNKMQGLVILIFDITDKYYAERNRAEFAANVSHELRTPLQSIMGSAELLENGLVKPENTKEFNHRIYAEAQRMLTLINDIIKLSKLDENASFIAEFVDLYDISNSVIEALQPNAEKKNIKVSLTGSHYRINGVHQLCYDIIYNLCDNAIKYNKENGSIDINLIKNDKTIQLSVHDTGIGIPIADQDRIFERFYRVDKSHSKETGGTGLGLSIVKHAVSVYGR